MEMFELIEHLREALKYIVLFAVLALEAVSVFCVLIGFARSLTNFPSWNAARTSVTPFLKVRVAFGRWLALALEFQLAADILSTTIEPSFQDLIRLSIIAIVRTFLNYFLEKEIVEQIEFQAKHKPEST